MAIKYGFKKGKLICSNLYDSYEQYATYGHYIAQKVGSNNLARDDGKRSKRIRTADPELLAPIIERSYSTRGRQVENHFQSASCHTEIVCCAFSNQGLWCPCGMEFLTCSFFRWIYTHLSTSSNFST